MRSKTATIRTWASAALGAALIGTSIFTGVSAANAAVAGGGAQLSLTAGSIGGSGTGTFGVISNSTYVFDNPQCSATYPTDGSTVVTVTIGAEQYVSPPLSSWATSTSVQNNVVGCWTGSSWDSSARGTVSTSYSSWTFDYSCQPAGTPVSATSSKNLPPAANTVVPDNGALPASCGLSTPTPTVTPTSTPAPTAGSIPNVEFSQLSGAPGSTFMIRGTGFAPSSDIAITFDGAALSQAVAGTDGSFVTPLLTVPASATPGVHMVDVSSAANMMATSFTVYAPSSGPTITLTPASGAAGAPLAVDGTGYPVDEPVIVQFDGITLQDLNADAQGNFSSRIAVPASATPGAHLVAVASENTGARAATFTVTAAPQTPAPTPTATQPAPSLSAASGVVGGHFTVSGSDYAPGETVTVELHSTPILLGTATVAANGTFSLDATVPAGVPDGNHTVTITAPSTGTQTIPFTVGAATAPTATSTPTATSKPTGLGGATSSTTASSGSGLAISGTVTAAGSAAVPSTAATASATGASSRGLAVQTAVDAARGASGDRAALTLWSGVTGILGLACAVVAVVLYQRSRRAL